MVFVRTGMQPGRLLRRTFLAASAVAAAIMLAAEPASSADSKLDIYFVAGATSDPFMSTIKRGADDAAKAIAVNGGSVHWLPLQNYDNIGPDVVKLLRSASSSHPAAIVGPDWVPEAENSALRQITSDGTPLILWNNSGNDSTAAVGAPNSGSREKVSRTAASCSPRADSFAC